MPSRTSSRRERSSSSSSSSSWNPLNLFCPGRRRRRMRRKQRQQLEALHRHFGDRVAVESSVMDSSETTVPVRNPPLHPHTSSRRVQDIPRPEPVEQSSSLGAADEMNPQVQERLWDIWKGYQHRVEEHRKSKRPKPQQPDARPTTTHVPMAAATSTTNSEREVDQPQDMTVFLVQQRAALKAYQELQQKQQRSRQVHSRPSRPRSKPLAPVMEENALVPFVRSPTTPRQYHEQIPHVVTPTPSPPGRMDVDESVYSYPDSDSVYISSHGGAYSYPQEGSMSLPSPSIACCEDASQDKMSSVTLPWDLMGEDEKPAVSMNISPASSSESMVSQSTMSTLEPPPSMFSSFGRFLHGDYMEDSAMDSILSAKPPPPQTSAAAAAASGYSHDTTDYSGWFSALQPPRFGRGQSIGSEGLGPQMPIRAER